MSKAFDPADHLDPWAGGLAAVANVVMQLVHPAVGYGVKESPVDSGSAMKHPVKRGRTTATFLSVAMLGNDDDKRALREAINSVHRHIRSGPDSPVAYNAFDRNLQLWVAACLAKGTFDITESLHGPVKPEIAEQLHQHFAAFGTSLQVRPEQWPADRAAFATYWEEALAEIHIDDTIRAYLMQLIELRNLPAPLSLLGRRFSKWITTAYLPELFREQMHLSWTARDQRRFERLTRTLGRVSRVLPRPLRMFPMNFYLAEMRFRVRRGLPLV